MRVFINLCVFLLRRTTARIANSKCNRIDEKCDEWLSEREPDLEREKERVCVKSSIDVYSIT